MNKKQYIQPVGHMARGDRFTLLQDKATRGDSEPSGIVKAGTECVVIDICGPYFCVDGEGHEIILGRDVLVDYHLLESNEDCATIKLTNEEIEFLHGVVVDQMEDFDEDEVKDEDFKKMVTILYNKLHYTNSEGKIMEVYHE